MCVSERLAHAVILVCGVCIYITGLQSWDTCCVEKPLTLSCTQRNTSTRDTTLRKNEEVSDMQSGGEPTATNVF